MEKIRDFFKRFPSLAESQVLTDETMERLEGGSCEIGCSANGKRVCDSGCQPGCYSSCQPGCSANSKTTTTTGGDGESTTTTGGDGESTTTDPTKP